jgi:hypothetical protein
LTYYKELFPAVDVQRITECTGSDDLTGADVALLYEKEVTNIAHLLVMPFAQLPPEARNLEFVINCLSRTAGIQVYYPLSLLKCVTS